MYTNGDRRHKTLVSLVFIPRHPQILSSSTRWFISWLNPFSLFIYHPTLNYVVIEGNRHLGKKDLPSVIYSRKIFVSTKPTSPVFRISARINQRGKKDITILSVEENFLVTSWYLVTEVYIGVCSLITKFEGR